jgi:hypothetical protein
MAGDMAGEIKGEDWGGARTHGMLRFSAGDRDYSARISCLLVGFRICFA